MAHILVWFVMVQFIDSVFQFLNFFFSPLKQVASLLDVSWIWENSKSENIIDFYM